MFAANILRMRNPGSGGGSISTYRYFRWDFSARNGGVQYGIDAFKLASSVGGTNLVPGKTASASSFDSAPYPASNALVADSQYWYSDTAVSQWWKVDLGAGDAIAPAQYGIMARTGFGNEPTAWTLSASNDDSTYVQIDSQSSIVSWTFVTYNDYVTTPPS